MGWLFGWENRKELVDRLLQDSAYGVLDSKSTAYGRHLWAVLRPTSGEERTPQLYLFLIERGRDGYWGYKDMSESMGPCYYDCPVSLFDLVPEPPNDYAREWREKVRKLNARAKQTYAEGNRVKVYGVTYQIMGRLRGSYLMRRVEPDGSLGVVLYRATARKMAPV